MILDKLLGNQSVIISLDVDNFLFERLQQIKESGFDLVEINSTDQKILTQAIARYPSLKIGAGSVIDTQQLEDCYQAGVHFATSPGYLPAIAQTANVYSINYLPGVATISEAMAVMSLGYKHVRPFPADLTFCTLLNKCLPHLKLFPAEIEWEEAEHFLNLPAVAAVSIHNPDAKQLNALTTGILA
ncbi:bifunctional 4-hydroxy-2-oxoglutarate aldolase/2-dehydro-3-deoxy-phosphogluconate aldolase [Fluoribacter dumoffii]|uniref:KHG/KDPG aldolase n=1 Tax=Fluoribacter dumoffii TaxID=463 RepID=A0A377GAL5_9GAMM|nr:bifunctional 4-hydroxy-2-oxoglutarate aldolase/2-dehydro-3-deoxy-phosphogluconate aldolase [Fluoribacter dumoffii]KTC88689.1 keto-hydroxyglutarate aldolase [Fluoribacter dumoffii NY 23]MCW8386018.1 bifunctional 4-hydroxy-2-oxoglutarate aldolase/2-dehydro-3-deoxy-phosphogluconate aldolase [Fluoribacter dumoffii]MCW8419070.1 bifunctional 4-hydroxy-2-oxoglutarate aldolase/2-dehydro-3-deoxy-phosphogluconate aldolase [Fluoribacter dumoffii]MCW8453086.1 bifunctional 4-hydroxy-2-oxoglutarate aldola